MQKVMEEDEPIESRMITKRIEGAQKAVEAQNFEARKHLLEYDDVMNKQREAVYGLRRQLLEGVEQRELILEDYVGGILSSLLDEYAGERVRPDQWDLKGLGEKLVDHFGFNLAASGIKPETLSRHELGEEIFAKLAEGYEAKEKILGAATMRYHERMVMLSVIDGLWKDHLLSMDHLKEGISLRGYAQRDPLVEYKRESFDMFEAMMLKFQEDTVRFLFRMQILGPDGQPMDAAPRPRGTVPKAPPVASAARPIAGDGAPREIAIPTRQPSTTIDELEKEFHRKKERELAAASRQGGGEQARLRSGGRAKRWGATIPAPAAAGRNTRSAMGRRAGNRKGPGNRNAGKGTGGRRKRRARTEQILLEGAAKSRPSFSSCFRPLLSLFPTPWSLLSSPQEAEEAFLLVLLGEQAGGCFGHVADGLRDGGVDHHHGSRGFAGSARGGIVVGNLPVRGPGEGLDDLCFVKERSRWICSD